MAQTGVINTPSQNEIGWKFRTPQMFHRMKPGRVACDMHMLVRRTHQRSVLFCGKVHISIVLKSPDNALIGLSS